MKVYYVYFIGIDVSRNELDWAVMHGSQLLFHRETKNTIDEVLNFLSTLKQLPKFRFARALFCLEHTGFYGQHLLNCLQKKRPVLSWKMLYRSSPVRG